MPQHQVHNLVLACHACSSTSVISDKMGEGCKLTKASTVVGMCFTGTIAQAVQPAIHDVTDGSVIRSWLNSPLSTGLESDIYKAANILNSFAQVGYLQPEKGIPAAVLQGAAGFAILSVVKVRFATISTCSCACAGAEIEYVPYLSAQLHVIPSAEGCLGSQGDVETAFFKAQKEVETLDFRVD